MLKSKKGISLILSLALTLGFATYSTQVFADDAKTITIIHTNDVHGRAEGDEKELIGYAKLKTFFDEQKSKNPNTVLVDAGDTVHGTIFANISEGKNMVNLMNEIGYLVSVPGNHDFNFGYEKLVDFSKQAEYDLLCANVVTKEGKNDFKPNMIKDIDGVKIGFFGLATPETRFKSSPKNTEDVEFLDYIEVAKEQVKELNQKGADLIVAVTHLGIDESSIERSDILAEQVEGIDLIVDGHSHTLLKEGKKVKNTLIVQAGEYLKNIGVVNVEVKDGIVEDIKANVVTFDDAKKIKADEKITSEIKKFADENKPFLDKKVGSTETELVGVREKVRTGETNLGDLITDAMKDSTSADLAITNGGGIRASMKQGDIKMGDVLTSFPFTNFVVGLEVKGDVVKKALEHGVDKAPEPAGKFPHVSGVTFVYDTEKPAGERVSDIMVNGQELDNDKTYKLATNDFLAIGGDDYKMFKGQKKFAENALLSDVLVEFIKKNDGKINYPENGNRIMLKGQEKEMTNKPVVDEKHSMVEEKMNGEAIPTNHKIIVNNKAVVVHGYVINGQKYFKIRDLAIAFSDTKSSFDVNYDKSSKSVVLKKNSKYTSMDKKLSTSVVKAPKLMETTQKIMVNGEESQNLKVYLINNSNYFNLSEISDLMDLNIK